MRVRSPLIRTLMNSFRTWCIIRMIENPGKNIRFNWPLTGPVALDALQELALDVVDDIDEVACILIDFQLAVGASARLQYLPGIMRLLTAVERIEDVVDKIQQFIDKHAGIDFFLLAEVDE